MQAAMDKILEFVPDITDVTLAKYEWSIPASDLMHMATKTRSSAPGPDGICYLALAHSAPWVVPVLKDIVEQAKLDSSSIPKDFNKATLALLPKGIEENDAPGNMIRDAGKVRPLTLSSVDSKIVAQAANVPIAGFACDVVCPNQKGGYSGPTYRRQHS